MRRSLPAEIGLLAAALLVGAGPESFAQDAPAVIAREVAASILRCFEAPKGFGPPYPAVGLLLNFRPDGNLDGPPQLSDPPGGDAKLSATTAAILSAAGACARIDNAARFRQDYPAWRSLRLTVRPGAP